MSDKPAWKITADDRAAWEIARGVIEHEDGLVNHRFTWLLILNGFLFTAVGSGTALFEKLTNRLSMALLWLGLLTLAAFGIASGLTALNLMKVAFDEIQHVRKWWNSHQTQELFPPLAGFEDRRYFFGIRPDSLIKMLMGVWTLLIILLFVLAAGYAPSLLCSKAAH
jgi:hypothetical protein